jgi:hypothetical protein
MMLTAPPWLLNREQSRRLQTYLQTYRRYAFVSLAPSVERNLTLRMLQAMQGKLIALLDQNTAHGVLHSHVIRNELQTSERKAVDEKSRRRWMGKG